MAESVIYNGHQVDKEGIRPTEEKMEAVLEAPQPQNVAELRSYLGLINYYGRFIANLSSILTPLNDLLKKGAVWRWEVREADAFRVIQGGTEGR